MHSSEGWMWVKREWSKNGVEEDIEWEGWYGFLDLIERFEDWRDGESTEWSEEQVGYGDEQSV
jgi:hypothetical protein